MGLLFGVFSLALLALTLWQVLRLAVWVLKLAGRVRLDFFG